MTVSVSPNRTEQWIPTRDKRTGRPLFVAVPSKSLAGKFHLVSSAGCDCEGFGYRGTCSHYRAVKQWAERRYSLTEAGKRYLATGELERRTEERVPSVGRISA